MFNFFAAETIIWKGTRKTKCAIKWCWKRKRQRKRKRGWKGRQDSHSIFNHYYKKYFKDYYSFIAAVQVPNLFKRVFTGS
jgi:hypothetical protein